MSGTKLDAREPASFTRSSLFKAFSCMPPQNTSTWGPAWQVTNKNCSQQQHSQDQLACALQALDAKKTQLVGDCLLTSSFLSYCGAFTYDFRDAMVYQMWLKDVTERKLPVSTPFR